MSNDSWLGLTEEHLTTCQGGHKLRAEVCDAFMSMQNEAHRDGIDLQIVSSYRNFQRQQAIWDAKWLGLRHMFDRGGQRINPEHLKHEQKLFAILIWSALPGASRHHWGTDLDVYDKAAVDNWQQPFELVAAEYEQAGPCHALNCWLAENAGRYGFYRPYAKDTGGVAPEAWHISYQPLAKKVIQQLDLTVLSETLRDSNIQGKEIILAHLDEVFTRFTLNGETS